MQPSMPIALVYKIHRVSAPFLLYILHPKAIDYELKTATNEEDTVAEGLSAAASSEPDTLEETIQDLFDMREHYHQRAHSNIHFAQERHKKYYDAKHDSKHVSLVTYIIAVLL